MRKFFVYLFAAIGAFFTGWVLAVYIAVAVMAAEFRSAPSLKARRRHPSTGRPLTGDWNPWDDDPMDWLSIPKAGEPDIHNDGCEWCAMYPPPEGEGPCDCERWACDCDLCTDWDDDDDDDLPYWDD